MSFALTEVAKTNPALGTRLNILQKLCNLYMTFHKLFTCYQASSGVNSGCNVNFLSNQKLFKAKLFRMPSILLI